MFGKLTNLIFGEQPSAEHAVLLDSQKSNDKEWIVVEEAERCKLVKLDENYSIPSTPEISQPGTPMSSSWIFYPQTRQSPQVDVTENRDENLLIEHPSMSVYDVYLNKNRCTPHAKHKKERKPKLPVKTSTNIAELMFSAANVDQIPIRQLRSEALAKENLRKKTETRRALKMRNSIALSGNNSTNAHRRYSYNARFC